MIYMKYMDRMRVDTFSPPRVMTLKREAAIMRRHTQIVTTLVMKSMLTTQLGICLRINFN